MRSSKIMCFIAAATPSSLVGGFVLQTGDVTTTSGSSPQYLSCNQLPWRLSSSPLNMGKNSDRAHIERNFEQMMGNDWREFRARLVAQERLEEEASKNKGTVIEGKKGGEGSTSEDNKSLHKQGQLGDLFAGAISSIFNNNAQSLARKDSKVRAAADRKKKEGSIFDGDTIGGASASSYADFESSFLPPTEDPFVSAEELPCHLQSLTKIDKHRWAHEIPHVETGSVLIANEKLGGVFHQTVVLIVQHNDQVGSIGIVINRPMVGDLLKIGSEQQSKLDLSLKLAFRSARVTYGGPVLTDEYSILHGFGEVEGSTKLCPGVYVGGSEELMNEVRINRFDPSKALFVKGHAAWTPKQLQREINKGVWYVAAVSSDFILRYAGAPVTPDDNPHDLWSDILLCIGGKHADIATANKGLGDLRLP